MSALADLAEMGIPLLRVPASLPCHVPVLPGTGEQDAPGEQRTETCSVDAWWLLGRAMVCTFHLRRMLGAEAVEQLIAELPRGIHENENGPWEQMRRYEQNPAALPEGHPLAVSA